VHCRPTLALPYPAKWRSAVACHFSNQRVRAGLWGLDDPDAPEVAAVLARAAAAPDDFVLKPQREGGGNNLYGAELAARLRSRGGLAAFILMQRIRPPVHMCAWLPARRLGLNLAHRRCLGSVASLFVRALRNLYACVRCVSCMCAPPPCAVPVVLMSHMMSQTHHVHPCV